MDREILDLANQTWQECAELGEANGYRNAQASLLAPTGRLTADTLVTTDRGLARLSEIGDVYGNRWQNLDLTVSTDEGPRRATKFFVNGEEPTRRISTEGGYKIQGTLTHRVKVVNPATAEWEWKRLAEIAPGDVLPVQMRTLVGEPRMVPLPVLARRITPETTRCAFRTRSRRSLPSSWVTSWATAACTRRESGCASRTLTWTSRLA